MKILWNTYRIKYLENACEGKKIPIEYEMKCHPWNVRFRACNVTPPSTLKTPKFWAYNVAPLSTHGFFVLSLK